MNIIIGNRNDLRLRRLNREIHNSLVTDTYCDLKRITEPVILIIPYEKINNNGFVNNTEISLDELLLKMNVQKIVYGNITNRDIMNNFTNNYHVKTIAYAF